MERKLSISDIEDELRATKEWLHLQSAALQSAANAISITDRDGTILWVNPAFERLTGYPAAELIGQNHRLLKSGEQTDAFYQHLWDIIAAGRVYHGELVNKRKDGSLYNEEMTIAPVTNAQGEITHYVAVKQDVTSRKRAEEQAQRSERNLRQSEERHRGAAEELQAVMEAAPVGLLVAHDPECHLITGNRPAHELLGVPMAENISATPGPQEASPYFRIFRQGLAANGAELPMQVAGATGRVVSDEELEVVRRDGTRRTMVVTAAPLYSPEGTIRGAVGAAVDITARKQAEETLRRAHGRTETILNSITDSFFAIDRQWRFTYVNAEAERVLRRPATQLVGGRYSELFPHAEAFEAHYAHAFATGKPGHFEEYYAPLQTWFECHAYPSPEGLSVYFRDISARKRVEHALRESEEKFRAIFEQAAIGIGRVSFTDARWIDVNDAFCRMLGYTREEMRATPWPEITHPEDVDLDLVPFRRMAAGELDTYSVEKRFIRHDGHHIWARLTLSLVRDPEGRPAYEIAIVENITGRKQAEETLRRAEQQFRALAESIPQLVWTAGAQGRVDYFNERWCAYTGLTLEQSTAGWIGVVHPDDRAGTLERWTKALTTGQPYETEYRLRGRDGQYRWFLGRGVPLRDARGAVGRWFGTCTDIDEHKRTLEALQESQKTLAHAKDELARTNRGLDRAVRERTAKLQDTIAELEQMSYSMIHDLRAPLRAIRSFGGIIAEDAENRLTVESREMIGKMITAADRMDHLVRDVLNYGRVVREDLALGPVDVEALARGIVETYPNLRASNAEVRVASDLPVVLGNAAALTQCLSQLLDNAVKFAKPGQPPKIQIKGEPGDNGWARLVVEDSGVGIAPGLQQKIFGIFQQLRNTSEGTGMGLAIVKKAVERMGGRVGVHSEPGRGSRFWIELRVAAEPVHEQR